MKKPSADALPMSVGKKKIGDKAYDSDSLNKQLKKLNMELIAPHKANREKAKSQDVRKLRRYKRGRRKRATAGAAAKLSMNCGAI